MADENKTDWPQTPEGAIDWETVFEHPESGIIPALSKAQTNETLHKGAVAVVRQLFTRKNDSAEVGKVLKELDQILHKAEKPEDLPKMQASINALLRRIKDDHIEKAAAYVAASKKKAAGGFFRKWKKKKRKERRGGDSRRRAVRLLVSVAMVAVLAGGAVPLLYFLYATEDTSSTPAILEELGVPLSDEGYPLGIMDPDIISKLGRNVMVLKGFTWSGQIDDGPPDETFLLPVLVVKSEDAAARICDYGSDAIEAIKLALEQTIGRKDRVTVDDLREAGRIAKRMVNKRRDKDWVRDLYLLYKIDTRLMFMSKNCQLVK